MLRHIALNLFRNNESFRGSIKTKRLNVATDTELFGEHCVQIKKFPTVGKEALQLLHALALGNVVDVGSTSGLSSMVPTEKEVIPISAYSLKTDYPIYEPIFQAIAISTTPKS